MTRCLPRHCERSEAISAKHADFDTGLLRFARNDDGEGFAHSTFTFASLITFPHFA
jgi:hypothetical protein